MILNEWYLDIYFFLIHFFFYYYYRKQARVALTLKAQSVFEQAFDLQERLAQQHEEKMKQRALCEQLANQVEIFKSYLWLIIAFF